MRRFVVGFFAVVGFLTVLLILGSALLVSGLKPAVTPLAENIILNVDLTQGLAEGPHEDRLVRLLVGAKPTLRDVLDGIETAESDPRVQVLLARVGDDELGLAKTQDLLHWDRLTPDTPALVSPHATGSLRYVDTLERGDELWLYYECARADGSHSLRLSRIAV